MSEPVKIEAADIIKALGYDPEKIKSVDDFKTSVNTDFIRRDNVVNDDEIVSKIVGHRLQPIEKEFFKQMGEFGIEVKEEDFKDAKYTIDKLKIGLGKMKEFHGNTTTELKSLAEKKGGDAAKEWQDKYAKADAKAIENENAVKTLQQQLADKEKSVKDQLKSYRVEDARKAAMSKVSFKDGLTDLERTGFETIFNSKYTIDLDDKDQPIIYEKGTNKRIDNKAVVGTYFGIEDVLKMEIELNKLGKANPHANNNVLKQSDPFKDANQNQNNNAGKPMIAPGFFKP